MSTNDLISLQKHEVEIDIFNASAWSLPFGYF